MNCRTPHGQCPDAQKGFTAVELLIATVLSAMLVVSVMGLLATMKAQCDQLVQRSHAQPWQALFAEQLRRDLANARYVVVAQNRMVLSGYLGTQGDALFNTLRAAEVTYRVALVDDVSCLLRDEHPLAVSSNNLTSRQLVATSISGLRMTLPDASNADGEYSGPVPESCRILFFDSSSATGRTEVLWCQ